MGVSCDDSNAGVTTACSLNEIQLYGLRAARAAGMSWGLAEEAGRAARWLAARGLPGAQLLTVSLLRNDGRAYLDIAPRSSDVWQARSGALCPICTGSALADRLASFHGTLQLQATTCPLLLLPFLDSPGRGGRQFVVTWNDATFVVGLAGLGVCDTPADALQCELAQRVCISVDNGREIEHPLAPAAGTIDLPDDTWSLLQSFAHRTYVPASEQSRVRGAGASGSSSGDND